MDPMTTESVLRFADLTTGGGTRAEQLAAAVEAQLAAGAVAPGTSLGTLETLREASGLSKPTVSEAVRLLADRGLVRIKPGRGGGIFVAERGPVVRLRNTLLRATEEPTTVADAIELRDHLELLVDLGAARLRTDADVDDLRRLLATMEQAPDWEGFLAANWRLHERIAAICPNAMARAVYVGTLGHLSSASAHVADGADASTYRARRLADHVELVDAIADGDPDRVREAVLRHNHVAPTRRERAHDEQ